jgi:hypothetical protein
LPNKLLQTLLLTRKQRLKRNANAQANAAAAEANASQGGVSDSSQAAANAADAAVLRLQETQGKRHLSMVATVAVAAVVKSSVPL